MAAADIRKNSHSFNLKSFNFNSRQGLIVSKIIYTCFHICQPANEKLSQISSGNSIFNR